MGDQNIREPAFYAYAYPAPDRLMAQPLQPDEAHWLTEVGYAFFTYDAVRTSDNPQQRLMTFLETTYQTCARLLDWEVKALIRP